MRQPKTEKKKTRQSKFETFESRFMMTANPVSDMEAVTVSATDVFSGIDQVEIAPSMAEVNQATGVDYIHDDYGFNGSGQTIAVIDSGIAWDHYALGGGFGENHKVVGGWDFAENDANPYDDGPVGFHGSHVAGIIGSTDEVNTGVASGADLVALRVFDDYGRGDFEMVEKALQWVHDHRLDFENPITTVNLSLGTKWNAESVPEWSQLEDEFALLENDGIFISVAAGNSFKSYQSKGLSYPASSEYVVPVSSHGSDGSISDFSQRNERVLVAPGEQIDSTVPEHVVGGRGAAKSFYSASGTSMATPYVAGASALLRQAMEFMGRTDIDQDMLYDHFRETADYVYDSATNTSYANINVGRAIDQVMGDAHGDTIRNAFDLGNLNDPMQLQGTIAKASDLDYFTFTAEKTGTASFTIGTTHKLAADVGLVGGGMQQEDGNYNFAVEAGKSYTFYVGTSNGIGHYEVNLETQAAQIKEVKETEEVQIVDWGSIAQKTASAINVSGESWFQFNAQQDGTVTFELHDGNDGADVEFEIYDSQMRLIDSSASGNPDRIDFTGEEGETYFVRLSGENSNVDVRVSNLLQSQDGTLIINGTEAADNIRVSVENQLHVTINDVEYTFQKSEFSSVIVNAAEGDDSVQIVGSSEVERAFVRGENFTFRSDGITIVGESAESLHFDGKGGTDRIIFRGTQTDETFTGRANHAEMTDGHYSAVAEDFERVIVRSRSAGDSAILLDSAGNDYLTIGNRNRLRFRTGGNYFVVDGMENVEVKSQGGNDYAVIHDRLGNKKIVGGTDSVTVVGGSSQTVVSGFDRVVASTDIGTNIAAAYRSQSAYVGNANIAGLFRSSISATNRAFTSSIVVGLQNTNHNSLAATSLTPDASKNKAPLIAPQQHSELLPANALAQFDDDDLSATIREVGRARTRFESTVNHDDETKAIDSLFSSEGDLE